MPNLKYSVSGMRAAVVYIDIIKNILNTDTSAFKKLQDINNKALQLIVEEAYAEGFDACHDLHQKAYFDIRIANKNLVSIIGDHNE